MNYDVFISYRRNGGFETAKHLNDLLVHDGYSVSFDIDTLREGNFDDALLKRIEQCSDFILVVDKHAFDRTLDSKFDSKKDWMRQELAYALKLKKNVLPIFLSGVDDFPDGLPEDIADVPRKNGAKYSKDYFDAFYARLKSFMHSYPRKVIPVKGIDNDFPLHNLKIISDVDCIFYLDGEEQSLIAAKILKKFPLAKGEYVLRFVSLSNRDDVKEMDFEMPEADKVLNVSLSRVNKTPIPDGPTTQQVEDDKNLEFVVNGVSFKMIQVQGGTFKMGAQSKDTNSDNYNVDAEKNESPVHNASVSNYFIGETLVTQSLWMAVMGTNPSFCKGDNLPVEQVSWTDCQKFIQNLNALTGETFHLPTEAEWEFAARGGTHSRGYKFAGGNSIGDVAWYRDNYADIAHPVKTKCPNELGLYDMSGSLCEWCDDNYGNYSSTDQIDPRGSSFTSDHVLRGGSRVSSARDCRVTKRELSTDCPNRYIGFRLALKKNTDENGKTLKVGYVEFKMIHVQGGNFLMGAQKEDTEGVNYDNDAYTDESPIHEVTLDEYYIGETEVTQALWKEVMGTEPTRDGGWTEELGRGDNYPVYWVSWNDCQEFIRKLNAKTGKAFRLPTEAEWEYAARGGNQHLGNKYAGGNVIDDVAWYTDNSDNKTHPVKGKWPNKLGLYDMSGNVWEWCQDWFSQSYYGESPSHNPVCKSGSLTRVLRGGSFHDFPRGCRVTVRGDFNSERHSRYHGLRLALSHL